MVTIHFVSSHLTLNSLCMTEYRSYLTNVLGYSGYGLEYKQRLSIGTLIFRPGTVFPTLRFLRNLRMGPIGWSLCPWQAFSVWCTVTLQLHGPICNLHKLRFCKYRPRGLYHKTFYSRKKFRNVEGQCVC